MMLRPMTMDDADKMLEWKNYPETRRFAIQSHQEITKEDHYKWLSKNLKYFQIIIINIQNKPFTIGAIRIEKKEVSIWIDRLFRGQGFATIVLKSIGKPGMTAKIVNGNIASMRAFVKAGFIPNSYHNDTYTIFKR